MPKPIPTDPKSVLRVKDDPNFKQYYDTPYYIGRMGKVFRISTNMDIEVHPYVRVRHNGCKFVLVKIVDPDGKRREKTLRTLIWETWKGKIPKGYGLINKNGLRMDCSLNNLELKTKSEIGSMFAGKTRHTRYVLDTYTNKVYIGCRACGEATGYTRQAVSDIVNGKKGVKHHRFKYLKKRPYEGRMGYE